MSVVLWLTVTGVSSTTCPVVIFTLVIDLVLVVQRLDSAVHWINLHPADRYMGGSMDGYDRIE